MQMNSDCNYLQHLTNQNDEVLTHMSIPPMNNINFFGDMKLKMANTIEAEEKNNMDVVTQMDHLYERRHCDRMNLNEINYHYYKEQKNILTSNDLDYVENDDYLESHRLDHEGEDVKKETNIKHSCNIVNETRERSNEIDDQLNETRAQSNETRAQSNEIDDQLNETRERSNEIDDQLNEIKVRSNKKDDQLNEIKGQSNEIEVKWNEARKQANETVETFNETRERSNEIDDQLNETRERSNEIDDQLNEIKGQSNEIEVKWNEARKQANETVETFNETRERSNEIDDQLNETRERSYEIEVKWNEAKEKSDEIEVKWNEAKEKSNEIEVKWNEAKEKSDEIEVKWNEAKEKSDEIEVKWNEAKEKSDEIEEKFIETYDQLNKSRARSNEKDGQLNETRAQSNETDDQLNETRAQSSETDDQLNETRAQSNETDDQLNETRAQSNETDDQLNETRAQSNEIKDDANKAEDKIHIVENDHMVKNSNNQSSSSTPNQNPSKSSVIKSIYDSNVFWESVSPLLFGSSWFDQFDYFQSSCESKQKKILQKSNISEQTRRLVGEYDTCRPQNLQVHEQYKHDKWGEDQFCDFELNSTDINFDLSFINSIKTLKITDKLARCAHTYITIFNYLSDNLPWKSTYSLSANRKNMLPSDSNVIIENTIDSSDNRNSANDTLNNLLHYNFNNHLDNQVPSSSFDLPVNNSTINSKHVQLGELAVPRRVQDVLDFSLKLSKRARRIFGTWILPSCPRRNRSSSTSLVNDTGDILTQHSSDFIHMMKCQKRRDKTKLSNYLKKN